MTTTASATSITLPRDTNQALGIGKFACDFLSGRSGDPSQAVLDRTLLFHTDSVICGISAIALNTNAPRVLREEAMEYRRDWSAHGREAGAPGGRGPGVGGAAMFGSATPVAPEKAIVANCAAVREWDSNGTNFGYNPALGHTAGEFGHNDFYPVCITAAQVAGRDGEFALRGMVCLDEIRGRLAEVFSLKTYRIDHVVHGAIAAAAVYGAMLGATPVQIESAIGMFVAHSIPWRAIRAGKQLSDSKGASAAISTEAAVLAMQRSMRGFIGPKDIFRNPEAIWRQFEPTKEGESPFDLALSHSGDDFAVMGMHFKLGLYEHQSAGALQGLMNLLQQHPELLEDPSRIASIRVIAYEPAFGIIGDPAKRDPRTRQSADHSMVYIIATTLRKAIEAARAGRFPSPARSTDDSWKRLMLVPHDYSPEAIGNRDTRALMKKITFEHGGAEYDEKYPDGIPTSIIITTADGAHHDSGLVMYPAGHARNTTTNLRDILSAKFETLGALAVENPAAIIARFDDLPDIDADAVRSIYDFQIIDRGRLE